MAEMVTLGSATQDIFLLRPDREHLKRYVTDHHELVMDEGAKVNVQGVHYALGGGALNAAVALQQLGNTVTPWCMVGNDAAGNFIVHELEKMRISTQAIMRSGEHSTGVTCIITCESCDALLLVYRGANSFADRTFSCPHDCVAHDLAKKLYTTPYWYCAPLSGEAAVHSAQLFQYVRPHVKGLAVNPSAFQLGPGFAQFREALPFVDVFICNAREARILAEHSEHSGAPLPVTLHTADEYDDPLPSLLQHFHPASSLVNLARGVLARGPRVMIITDGAHGAYVVDSTTVYFHPAASAAFLNTVGAGDAFGSTFFSYVIGGETIPSALARAMINSAAVLQGLDAQAGLLSAEELQRRYERRGTSLVRQFSYE